MSYLSDIHYLPDKNYHNVRCLNGSGHLIETHDLSKVTCKKCLDSLTCQDYWIDHFLKADLNKSMYEVVHGILL